MSEVGPTFTVTKTDFKNVVASLLDSKDILTSPVILQDGDYIMVNVSIRVHGGVRTEEIKFDKRGSDEYTYDPDTTSWVKKLK